MITRTIIIKEQGAWDLYVTCVLRLVLFPNDVIIITGINLETDTPQGERMYHARLRLTRTYQFGMTVRRFPQRKCPSQRVECYSGERSAGVLSKTCHIDSSPRTSLCLWQFESEDPRLIFCGGGKRGKEGGRGGKRRLPESLSGVRSSSIVERLPRFAIPSFSRTLSSLLMWASPRRRGRVYPHPSTRDNSAAKFPRLGGGRSNGYVARS